MSDYKYSFENDGVTQSMIAAYLRCPYQCKLEYIDGWKPKEYRECLDFGTVVHDLLERIYKYGKSDASTQIDKWGREIGRDRPTNEESEIVLAKAEALTTAYCIYYHEDFQEDWELAEESFKIPITLPNGITTFLRGKIDLGKNIKIKRTVFWDHKTKQNPNIDNLLVYLDKDLQLNFYANALDMLGNTPSEAKLNIIKNTRKKPLKSKKETIADYKQRLIQEAITEPKEFFYRINLPLAKEQINKWRNNRLIPLLMEMYHWSKYPEDFAPRETSFETWFGQLSPYTRIICQNDYTWFEQKEVPFEELN